MPRDRAVLILGLATLAGCHTSPAGPDLSMAVPDMAVTSRDLAADELGVAYYSGSVYVRDPDGGYTLDAAVPTVPDVTVTSDDGAKTKSGADGTYELTTRAGFRTLSAAPSGYIPIHASDELKAGGASKIDLALYAAPAVMARPGMIKGVITLDAGSWINDVFYPSAFPTTYDAAVMRMSPSMMVFSDPIFIDTIGTSTITLATQSHGDPTWRMLDETETGQLIMGAHSRGLQFMMFTEVFDDGSEQKLDGVGLNDIVYAATPPSSAFWDAYFAQYQQQLVARAAIAERQGAEWLCVEQHAGYLTQARSFGSAAEALSRWTTVINAVRAVYSGKLTYFELNSPVENNYESDNFAPGFVELFDAIGIEVQELVPPNNPSRAQLVAGYRALLAQTSFDKPIFVMLITPSVDGGTSFDTYIEPAVDAHNQIANLYPRNLWQQADAYEALFEAVNGTPLGDGNVMGIFTWGYYYLDEYYVAPGGVQLATDKSASVRGKPAEAILNYWFQRM